MGIILTILFLCFVGLCIISLLDLLRGSSLLEKIGFSYGIGVGCVALQMFFYSIIHISWSREVLVIPWLLLSIGMFFKRKALKRKGTLSLPKDKVSIAFLLLLGIVVSYVVFEAVLRPVSAWDAWSNWFIGGKAFYLSKSVDASFITYVKNSNPPMINLLVSLTYIFNGGIEQRVTLLVFTFFYVCLLIVFYYSLSRVLSQRYALLFALLLAMTQNLIRHAGRFDVGHADLPLGYFIFCSFSALILFFRAHSWRSLLLVNLFLGFSALIKSDGIPFLIFVEAILAVTLFQIKQYKKLFSLLLGVGIFLSWMLFKMYYHLPNNPFIQGPLMLTRIPSVTIAMFKELLNIGRWNMLWIVFLLQLCTLKPFKKQKIYYLLFFLQLFTYFIVYLLTPREPVGHIEGSFDRLLLQITPIAVFLIASSFTSIPSISIKSKGSER